MGKKAELVAQIEEAMDAHNYLLWMSRFIAYGIKSDFDPKQIEINATECKFGKWLYTNEKWIIYFFGHELFYELEKLHKAWHDENNKIMELYNKHNRGLLSKFIHHHRIADEDLDKAKAYYDEVKRISKALTDKMETLKIRTESMSETRLLDEFPK